MKLLLTILLLFFANLLSAQDLLRVDYYWERSQTNNHLNRFTLLMDSSKSYIVNSSSIKKRQTVFGNKFQNHAELVDYNIPMVSYQVITSNDGKLTTFQDTAKIFELTVDPDSSKTILGYKCKLASFKNKANELTLIWFSEDLDFNGGPFCYFPLGVVLELKTEKRNLVAKKIYKVNGMITDMVSEKVINIGEGKFFIKKRD